MTVERKRRTDDYPSATSIQIYGHVAYMVAFIVILWLALLWLGGHH